MSIGGGYGGQVAALLLASLWPVVAIGLVLAAWVGELIPHAERSRIARRGPKPPLTQARLDEGHHA